MFNSDLFVVNDVIHKIADVFPTVEMVVYLEPLKDFFL